MTVAPSVVWRATSRVGSLRTACGVESPAGELSLAALQESRALVASMRSARAMNFKIIQFMLCRCLTFTLVFLISIALSGCTAVADVSSLADGGHDGGQGTQHNDGGGGGYDGGGGGYDGGGGGGDGGVS